MTSVRQKSAKKNGEIYHRSFNVRLPLSKKIVYLLRSKFFKNDEKWFLFHLKSSLHYKDIQIFLLTFWSCSKNGLTRKIWFFQSLWWQNLVNKQLQYAYCPNSHEVKATRQIWSLNRVQQDIFLRKSCRIWGRKHSSRSLFVFQKSFL